MQCRWVVYLVILLGLLSISCSTDSTPSGDPPFFQFSENNGGLTLPDHFRAVVVTDSIGSARHIVVRENGDMYVALFELHNGNGIAALRDINKDGVADTTVYFGEFPGTGIDIKNDYLYFASNKTLYRYSLPNDNLVPESEPEVIAYGFLEQNEKKDKAITLDDGGNVYIKIGAPANACQETPRTIGAPGMDPCPQLEWHAGIWRFDADRLGQTLKDDGYRYATGIRNAVALDWNHQENLLYVVQQGRDQLRVLWPGLYTIEENAELPAEEFIKVNDGDNFGWPYTYYDHLRGQKMLNPEYGGDGETPAPEGQYKDPFMAFPGHWSPNDLLFYTGNQFPSEYHQGGFIAFHGSWNRAPMPQQGYKVVFVPFDGANPANREYQTFADGFAGEAVLMSPEEAEHRPMGLAQGPDGSLYVVDSKHGKMWRIIYTGR